MTYVARMLALHDIVAQNKLTNNDSGMTLRCTDGVEVSEGDSAMLQAGFMRMNSTHVAKSSNNRNLAPEW